MKSSIKRTISIALAVFLFIGTLVVYNSFVKPAYEKTEEKRLKLMLQQATEEQLKSALEQVKKLYTEYQDADILQETISLILPKEYDLPNVVAQITGLAKNNNLVIESLSSRQLAIKPSIDPALIKGLGTLRFDIRLVGDYKSFKAFLEQLESNIRLINLFDLKMEQFAGAPGQNIFLYTITVDTYYQTQ